MPLVSEKPIFTIHSPLGGIQKLGMTPYGERRIIDIHGGTVEGPKLKGKVLPGGADWQIVRSDGVVHLTARYTIETESGGKVLVNAEGSFEAVVFFDTLVPRPVGNSKCEFKVQGRLIFSGTLAVQRDKVYFRTPADFTRELPRGANARGEDVGVGSEYFVVEVRTRFGDARARGTALLSREGQGWPRTLWRKVL